MQISLERHLCSLHHVSRLIVDACSAGWKPMALRHSLAMLRARASVSPTTVLPGALSRKRFTPSI
jgi:hypothetical protein